ncbi:MAG: CsbD family protein [Alphaproteobacteria bacterium]|nr:CsbD family protein [Alphaproteobacteria bacterium]
MNSDQIQGKWEQIKGAARKQWGRLTDDDIVQIEGDRELLVGKIQERYGIAREEAEKQVSDWAN